MHNYPADKGRQRKRRLLVMREIGVQTLPYIKRWQTSGGSSTIDRGKGTGSIVKDRVHLDIGARKPLQYLASSNWGFRGQWNKKQR